MRRVAKSSFLPVSASLFARLLALLAVEFAFGIAARALVGAT